MTLGFTMVYVFAAVFVVLVGYSRCWFGHADGIRERDEQGRMVLRCPRCHEAHRPALEKDAYERRGPAHVQGVTLGQPTGRVSRASTRTKVTPFRQSER